MNEKKNSPYISVQKILRKISYVMSLILPESVCTPDNEPIDVVIPVVEKDLKILPLCLEGVRNCVQHPIRNIYIVAKESEYVMKFCDQEKLQFVEETSVLGYGPASLHIYNEKYKMDRSGWIFQQLLKLSGKIGTCRYYLVIDSDHILLRPHTFIAENGKSVFYQSIQYHIPYYRNIAKLMGSYPNSSLSYVAHKMIFDKDKLNELHSFLEKRWHTSWDWAILNSLNRDELSCFSEFELYGNFVNRKEKLLLPWKQKSFAYNKIDTYFDLKRQYEHKYRAITFPDFKNKK